MLARAAEDDTALAPVWFGAKALKPNIETVTDTNGGRVLAQSEARRSGQLLITATALQEFVHLLASADPAVQARGRR